MTHPVRARVILGHVLDALEVVPERSIQCMVTSCPYWGLRDYGTASWQGGDRACLHLNVRSGLLTYGQRKRKWQHANNGLMLAAARAGEVVPVPPSAQAALDGSYRQKLMAPAGGAVCLDCGAVRMEPTVWGGDPDCPHEWETEQLYFEGGGPAHRPEGGFWGGGKENVERLKAHRWRTSQTCIRCGGWRGALGLEPSPDLYVAHLVEVMRAVRRVLRDDGVAWLNMGDCYATGAGPIGQHPGGGEQGERFREAWGNRGDRPASPIAHRGLRQVPDPKNPGAGVPVWQPNRFPIPGLKPKDLVLMPARVALALQADGWWLRMDVVWNKPNPMPESVADRPTRAHEYVFLLTKAERYFYDADAIREPFSEGTYRRVLEATFDEQESGPKDYGRTGVDPSRSARRGLENLAPKVRQAFHDSAVGRKARATPNDDALAEAGINRIRPAWDKTAQTPHLGGRRQAPEPGEPNAFHPLGRNKRSVWTIPTQPYPEAHFATFPEALVLPCILAGTSERGACPDCGKPWVRVTAATGGTIGRDWNKHDRGTADLLVGQTVRAQAGDGTYRRYDLGWRPGCVCRAPAALGLRPDDFDVILSPESEWTEEDQERDDDPSFEVGRAGFARPRRPDEGFRPITRYEQRKYAGQLRAVPADARAAMEEEAGPEAFAHYLRTDDSGARPIPERLLAEWVVAGRLEAVELPDWSGWAPEPVPCTVLDPFAGSGTTLLVAAKNGRDSVGVELKPDYLRLILGRLAPMEADLLTPVMVTVEKAPPWTGGEGEGDGREDGAAGADLEGG